MGTRSSTGPSTITASASIARPAAVPRRAGRGPRIVATASTIVNASTTSTNEARNAAVIAGAAVVQVNIDAPLISLGKHHRETDIALSLRLFAISQCMIAWQRHKTGSRHLRVGR